MVSSLDGFIAKKDGDISWMHTNDCYEDGIIPTKEFITEFLKSIDCYVMGSKTYDHALELGWAYGETPVVVLTHKKLKTHRKTVEFFSGDLNKLVNDHLKPNYKNIWVVGGSMVTKDFIRLKLADEIRISFMPIILGDGLLFFDYIGKEQSLHLKNVTAYKDGMVELHYELNK
jgi:dihydrofolate reductase